MDMDMDVDVDVDPFVSSVIGRSPAAHAHADAEGEESLVVSSHVDPRLVGQTGRTEEEEGAESGAEEEEESYSAGPTNFKAEPRRRRCLRAAGRPGCPSS